MRERSDHYPGTPISLKEVQFSECVDQIGITNIPSSGTNFTWRNKRVTGFLAKKLDRMMAYDKWIDAFPSAAVEILAPDFSDHSARILQIASSQKRKYSFKFFNFLTRHRDFLHIVQDHWSSCSVYGTNIYQLCTKLACEDP